MIHDSLLSCQLSGQWYKLPYNNTVNYAKHILLLGDSITVFKVNNNLKLEITPHLAMPSNLHSPRTQQPTQHLYPLALQ